MEADVVLSASLTPTIEGVKAEVGLSVESDFTVRDTPMAIITAPPAATS
jgi:hypothetical protein